MVSSYIFKVRLSANLSLQTDKQSGADGVLWHSTPARSRKAKRTGPADDSYMPSAQDESHSSIDITPPPPILPKLELTVEVVVGKGSKSLKISSRWTWGHFVRTVADLMRADKMTVDLAYELPWKVNGKPQLPKYFGDEDGFATFFAIIYKYIEDNKGKSKGKATELPIYVRDMNMDGNNAGGAKKTKVSNFGIL